MILPKAGIQEYKITISNCNDENKPMVLMTYRKKQLYKKKVSRQQTETLVWVQ